MTATVSAQVPGARAAPLAMLMLVATMLAGNVVAARVAMDYGTDLATLVAVRCALAALVASLMVLHLRIPTRLREGHWRALPVVCVLVGLQSLCLYAAVQRMPVALAVLIFNTHPLWSVAIDAMLYRRAPTHAVVFAMPVILFGLALALEVPMGASAPAAWDSTATGAALALMAAVSFAAMLVLSQHEVADLDGRYRTAITMGVVGSLAAGTCLAQGGPQWPGAATGWWALAAVSLLYGLAFTILVTVLPRIGVTSNSPLLSVEPVAALLLAWLLLEQQISALQMLGIAVVMSAVLMLCMRDRVTGVWKPRRCRERGRRSNKSST